MKRIEGKSADVNDSLGAYPIFWTTPFAALDSLTASTKATASVSSANLTTTLSPSAPCASSLMMSNLALVYPHHKVLHVLPIHGVRHKDDLHLLGSNLRPLRVDCVVPWGPHERPVHNGHTILAVPPLERVPAPVGLMDVSARFVGPDGYSPPTRTHRHRSHLFSGILPTSTSPESLLHHIEHPLPRHNIFDDHSPPSAQTILDRGSYYQVNDCACP